MSAIWAIWLFVAWHYEKSQKAIGFSLAGLLIFGSTSLMLVIMKPRPE